MNTPLFSFDNTQTKMPDAFYERVNPTPVKKPDLIKLNEEFATELGLDIDALKSSDAIDTYGGNYIPEGADPIALAYAGHQFGNLVPQLGDGRAILLGEVVSPEGIRYDIQLKGAGRTPFSRGGDGRAAIGPIMREYLLSEAMVKLGVPTTRALAAVTTGEEVVRDRILPGAVITRIATGFVRVGTFQYFAIRDNKDAVKQLADSVIARNYPEVTNAENPYLALLEAVAERQATLIAKWMQFGFIHGVMNTDNMSIAGETIDYGPCAFMDEFDFNRVYSSIDRNGRYAYSNQPIMGQWNLIRLAETFLPLLHKDSEQAVSIAEEILKGFQTQYEVYWLEGMRSKIGLTKPEEGDRGLINELLQCMADNKADFTLTFHYLSQLELASTESNKAIRDLFTKPEAFDAWAIKWRERLTRENSRDEERKAAMQAMNPIYIPRNHQIEAAIRAAEDHDDFSVFHELYDVLQTPFNFQSGKESYMLPPEPEEEVLQTFCGT
ncbi:MAG: Selenoprotein O and cysteine-containing homologs [uncultured Thiotrichaceae bacterium]|uniref:Protein nucleotidyltransferase YdiU n=1 Tax=uncultured Thiotrichaceae bacterium TaxID=298394 RepID=A0A6S6SJ60_9GAMM|nr:MAG: Selenoprotein O and cysteine-containing homologs [uncultured Thiotrichaceae bacterium]